MTTSACLFKPQGYASKWYDKNVMLDYRAFRPSGEELEDFSELSDILGAVRRSVFRRSSAVSRSVGAVHQACSTAALRGRPGAPPSKLSQTRAINNYYTVL